MAESAGVPPAPDGAEGVCIVSPLAREHTETFIEAHAHRLPARVSRLCNGYFPTRTGNGRHLLTPIERSAAAVCERRHPATAAFVRTRALRRYLHRNRIAAVLAEYGPTGVSVLAACQAADVPLVVHFHGSDAFKERWLRDYGLAYPRLCATAAAVIGVSREMVEQLATLGAPRERLFLNPCGADTTRFRGGDPARAPATFVSVGRFVDKKAPHLTVLAFKPVLDRCPDARLVMIGEGELLDTCRTLTHALGIGHAVEFPGALPPEQVAARMRMARAFVQHSIRTPSGDREGTPVAVLEAGATGLPVVATRHAGIPDVVVDGETGLLVEEGAIGSMSRYLEMLATDAARAAALGRAARQRVTEHFSLDRSIEGLWRIIALAIRQHRRSREA